MQSGNNNPNYKDGRSLKEYYCKNCGINISYQAGFYGQCTCKVCAIKKVCNDNKILGRLKNPRPKIQGVNHPHYGKTFSKETRAKISKNHADMKGKNNPMYGKVTHGKGSRYNGIYMRSSWEIIFAKYLDDNNIKWQYEPKAFEISYTYDGKEKEGTYRPDFYLPHYKLYIEVKGYWRDDAKTKFEAFRAQYKDINIVICNEEYINAFKSNIDYFKCKFKNT